ncbi:MAG: PilZ domain-containing protein [Sphingomonas sp.]|nr:PilZ domain-containing protein [Sphingomonas sp.]
MQSEPSSNDRQPRRVVELKGFGVLDDGTTFAISVVDLSYDGCKVQTDLALIPGLTLKVSILGAKGAVPAVVRWYKEGVAGLRFNPEPEPAPKQTPRDHERIELTAQLSLRRAGRQQYAARLFDITPTGCRVEFIERPRPEERLWVKFDGLDAFEATVRWVDGFYGGLEFVRPIYPAVFDMVLARLRA